MKSDDRMIRLGRLTNGNSRKSGNIDTFLRLYYNNFWQKKLLYFCPKKPIRKNNLKIQLPDNQLISI